MNLLNAARAFVATTAATVLLVACSTISHAPVPPLERDAKWVLLPLANQTETPQAGLRAEGIVDSVLRSDAGLSLERYPADVSNDGLFDPANRKASDAALAWARTASARYAVTGSVDEWRYKVGIDGEPAVGLTLRIVDVPSGKTIWSATGGKTGYSREALSAVAQKLARNLVAPVAASTRR
ncbi:MAG TPA: penicillin-binding protein activator LpoB [Burkholderiaceae bacterium]|nr:penicillin-binding protein activator LpoB [Burkholderiaceae bacterium]